MSMLLIFACILLLGIIIVASMTPRKESFVVPNGLCDCCHCGWMSCQECERQRDTCCGSSGMGFDRYTFS